MHIKINNKPFECLEGNTVLDVLTSAEIKQEHIAVAMNNRIVPKAEWAELKVIEGADLVIIKAVQGG